MMEGVRMDFDTKPEDIASEARNSSRPRRELNITPAHKAALAKVTTVPDCD